MKKHRKLKISVIVLSALILALLLIVVPCKVMPVVSNSLSLSAHSKEPALMVAHRGLSSLCPENTLPAFEMAVAEGFDGYELDLHTTADGKWVVIHDDTVDKMTDGTGNVEDMTFEQIRSLNIDSGNGIENYSGLRIPTLEEAMEVCQDNSIIPVIEIKKCDVRYLPELKEYLDETEISEKAVIISFTREYLEEYRRLDSDIQMLLLKTTPTTEDIDWCMEYNAGINFHHMLLYKCHGAIKYARENGVKIAVWTVDNTVYKDIMVLFGAEMVTTNKIIP